VNEEEEWVVLRRYDDPLEAQIAVDFLRHHDVRVSLQGNSGSTSVLNRFDTVLDIRVVVPRSDAASAREVLDAMTVEVTDEQPFRGPAPPSQAIEPLHRRRYRRAGFALALAVPIGGGHFYARHNAGAIVIGGGIVGGFLGVLLRGPPALLIASASLVLIDALFAPAAVRRFNEGRVPSEEMQRKWALGAVAVSYAVAIVVSFL
jgi:Putative prokaryotic signal transducing protein